MLQLFSTSDTAEDAGDENTSECAMNWHWGNRCSKYRKMQHSYSYRDKNTMLPQRF